ncbi:MAG: hypothetical protein AAF770_02920 [Bacteroidota bacterium]
MLLKKLSVLLILLVNFKNFLGKQQDKATTIVDDKTSIAVNELATKTDLVDFVTRVKIRLKQEMLAKLANDKQVLLSNLYKKIYEATRSQYFRKQVAKSLEDKKLTKEILQDEKFLNSYIQGLVLLFLEEENNGY